MLEDIHDSFELGTILRCVEAFGIKGVLCVMQNVTSHLLSGKTITSSMGAIFHLNLSVSEGTAGAVSHCRGHGMQLIAAMPHCNEDLARSDFPSFLTPCAVALGNEADGLSLELLAGADTCVRIELFGIMESLNVAVTIAIVLHAVAMEEHKSDTVEAKK